MVLGLDDIHELTKLGLTNLDVIIIGETVQYTDFTIDDETVSLIITKEHSYMMSDVFWNF